MKKTIISLATASLIATGAMAADKGVDIVTTGQAVIYYETHQDGASNSPDLFDQKASQANVGVQLNLGADLGNNFTFGSQLSYLGTLGLENDLVSGVKQSNLNSLAGQRDKRTADDVMLSKIFIAKKIANTTLKLGRQELPKSLSPLAFSEGWNVYKNTFDAILAVNSDIPNTTVVGAYVGGSMGVMPYVPTIAGDLSSPEKFNMYGSMNATSAYMLTVQNKSIPMTTITASYYDVTQAAQAAWIDASVAGKNLPLGLKIGLQAGSLMPEANGADDTSILGLKVGMKPIAPLYVQLAYSSVNDGAMAVKNVGTGIKTPLFTQMIYNQNAIARDADTIVVKAAYNTGDYGKVIAQYGMTTAGTANINGENDYNELDIIYRLKSGGVSYWVSAMIIDTENAGGIIGAAGDSDTKLRVWARYNF